MAKILVVEDDTNLKEIYATYLKTAGYTVLTAGNGQEALEVLENETPDLVITDTMMPRMSGFDMIEAIRAKAEIKDMPIIMMTALDQAEDEQQAQKLGVIRYLVKSQVSTEDYVRAAKDVLDAKGITPDKEKDKDKGKGGKKDSGSSPKKSSDDDKPSHDKAADKSTVITPTAPPAEDLTSDVAEPAPTPVAEAPLVPSTNPFEAAAEVLTSPDAPPAPPAQPAGAAPVAAEALAAASGAEPQTNAAEEQAVEAQINDFLEHNPLFSAQPGTTQPAAQSGAEASAPKQAPLEEGNVIIDPTTGELKIVAAPPTPQAPPVQPQPVAPTPVAPAAVAPPAPTPVAAPPVVAPPVAAQQPAAPTPTPTPPVINDSPAIAVPDNVTSAAAPTPSPSMPPLGVNNMPITPPKNQSGMRVIDPLNSTAPPDLHDLVKKEEAKENMLKAAQSLPAGAVVKVEGSSGDIYDEQHPSQISVQTPVSTAPPPSQKPTLNLPNMPGATVTPQNPMPNLPTVNGQPVDPNSIAL